MKAVKNKYPGGGKMKRQMMMEMGGKMKKKRPMYQEGNKVKAAKPGVDYTNDKQAIRLGVKVDYSDPFRNLTPRDAAFLKSNLSGYASGEKVRVNLGNSMEGGYFTPQQVANARKSARRETLGMMGKVSSGSKRVGGPTINMTKPFGFKAKEETKERPQTIATSVTGPSKEGGESKSSRIGTFKGDDQAEKAQQALDAKRQAELKRKNRNK